MRSTILTISAAVGAGALLRALIGLMFSDDLGRRAIATNLRLLMTEAYPAERYVRIWVAVGLVAALVGLSLAVWHDRGTIAIRSLVRLPTRIGTGFAIIALLGAGRLPAEWAAFFSVGAAALLTGGWAAGRRFAGSVSRVSAPRVGAIVIFLALLALWTVPFGRFGYEGGYIAEPGTVAMSTKLPWTVVGLVMIASFRVGRYAASRLSASLVRSILTAGWALSMPVVVLVIMRAPDLAQLRPAQDVLVPAAVVLIGAGLLWLAAGPYRTARSVLGTAALAVALWPATLPAVARVLAAVLAIFALAAPRGHLRPARRLRYAAWWVAISIPLATLTVLADTPSTIGLSSTYLGGLALTLVLAVAAITISLPLGLLLALARTSSMPVFRTTSIVFIEVIRGVPILILFVFADHHLRGIFPRAALLDEVVFAIGAASLYFSAYMAENLRGGLQAVPEGHKEAARSLGLGPFQTTLLIVLPQAVRAVVPALVGQAIQIFKETSLVSIIGLWELLYIGSKVIPNQTEFIGTMRQLLIFVAVIYWAFTFSISRASLRLERRLGLGEETHYGAL